MAEELVAKVLLLLILAMKPSEAGLYKRLKSAGCRQAKLVVKMPLVRMLVVLQVLGQLMFMLVLQVAMQTKFTKIFIALFVLLAILPLLALAESDREPYSSSYVFYLYYDNGQIFADRDFELKYDVIPEEYKPVSFTTQFPFRGEITNFLNQVVAAFQFDPRGGDITFIKGKVKVKAPYVPDGQKAVFYDSQGRTLLTIFVNESSFCNDDWTCNSERGEDARTCPNDCQALPTTNDQQPTTGEGGLSAVTVALIASAIAAVGAGGWYAWRRWKKAKYVQEDQFTSKLG